MLTSVINMRMIVMVATINQGLLPSKFCFNILSNGFYIILFLFGGERMSTVLFVFFYYYYFSIIFYVCFLPKTLSLLFAQERI